MRPLGTMLVCAFEVGPGLTVSAAWDGGRTIGMHVVRGNVSARVAGWPIWNDAWDTPLIEPTRESFERFIAGRLGEPGAVDELLDLATA